MARIQKPPHTPPAIPDQLGPKAKRSGYYQRTNLDSPPGGRVAAITYTVPVESEYNCVVGMDQRGPEGTRKVLAITPRDRWSEKTKARRMIVDLAWSWLIHFLFMLSGILLVWTAGMMYERISSAVMAECQEKRIESRWVC